jgi:hypothetical protein
MAAPSVRYDMRRFKNVLVVINPQNDNSTVLNRAVDLATRNQARARLVSIIDEPPDEAEHLTAELPTGSKGPALDYIEDWPRTTGFLKVDEAEGERDRFAYRELRPCKFFRRGLWKYYTI